MRARYKVTDINEDDKAVRVLIEGESRGGEYELLLYQNGDADVHYIRPDGDRVERGDLISMTVWQSEVEYSR